MEEANSKDRLMNLMKEGKDFTKNPKRNAIVPISTLEACAAFGEVEVIRGVPRQTTAVTSSNSVIYEV